MPPIDEPASFEPKPAAAEGRRPKTGPGKAEQPASGDLISFTVEPAAGRIVKIERVDSAGDRHEFSAEETARLARSDAEPTLERIVEQAFEAGIDCVLGDEAEGEQESTEDAVLSRALLQSLIERSAAKRLLQREILGRAIIGTLMEQAADSRARTPESAAAH
ncbi:MAG TPA: hypothetical protein VJS38_03090 [Phenylobacterium sp.]|uniref:hypothetical protein n=1 Tax=Phenylobacterium sp. TaxID=1871053 RepID=UPI002B481534|nr:hypothetical protein [Phenylobacterium sp.]HKR87137.1 hypothetical protein [Phenylobacterium sp.]